MNWVARTGTPLASRADSASGLEWRKSLSVRARAQRLPARPKNQVGGFALAL
jgi:hypothetical protein